MKVGGLAAYSGKYRFAGPTILLQRSITILSQSCAMAYDLIQAHLLVLVALWKQHGNTPQRSCMLSCETRNGWLDSSRLPFAATVLSGLLRALAQAFSSAGGSDTASPSLGIRLGDR